MPTYTVRTGKTLTLSGALKLPRGDSCIEMLGGKLKLNAPVFSGGSDSSAAVNALKADALGWDIGGTGGPIGKYMLYAGDVSRGDNWICRNIHLRGVICQHGIKHEAVIRLMGATGLIEGCDLNVVTQDWRTRGKRAQVIQARHARVVIRDCNLGGSIANGSLGEDIAGGIYTDYAAKFPAWIVYENCTITGGCNDAGNCNVLYRNCTIAGKDPRGVDGRVAFTQRFHKTRHGSFAPTTLLVGCRVHGFPELASPGVIVGPNCFVGGSKVPAEISGEKLKALADKIEKAAFSWN